MKVIAAAQRAKRLGLCLVIDFRGRTRLRREIKPGDQKIAVVLKLVKAA